MEEVELTLKSMKNANAADNDGITNELLKRAGSKIRKILTNIYVCICICRCPGGTFVFVKG